MLVVQNVLSCAIFRVVYSMPSCVIFSLSCVDFVFLFANFSVNCIEYDILCHAECDVYRVSCFAIFFV